MIPEQHTSHEELHEATIFGTENKRLSFRTKPIQKWGKRTLGRNHEESKTAVMRATTNLLSFVEVSHEVAAERERETHTNLSKWCYR